MKILAIEKPVEGISYIFNQNIQRKQLQRPAHRESER